MKKFRTFLLIILILPCALLFSACSKKVYVTGIEKTSVDGTATTYTVTYSDGTCYNFTVENGENGEDGEDISIENVFENCVERGLYENTNDGFRAFLKDYLSFEVEQNDVKSATNKAMCSAVNIYSLFKVNETENSFFYQSTNKKNLVACGAGVIYNMNANTDESYIITNYHVVYENNSVTTNKIANKIYAYLYGSTRDITKNELPDRDGYSPQYTFAGDYIECEYIGGSMTYDIAVLKVSTTKLLEINSNACQVKVSAGYEVSDTAIAIGNPEGEGISVTKGIVNVDSEHITMNSLDGVGEINYRVMRIDTAINGGNSGGGLFNDKGELIGIVNAKIESEKIDNIAYAIPAENATKVANNIIKNYRTSNTIVGVKKVVIGVSTYGDNGRYIYNPITSEIKIVDDTVVNSVEENSLAELNRLQKGDILTAIEIVESKNKLTLTRSYQLREFMLDVNVGQTVKVYYIRNGIPNSFMFTATEDMMQVIK